MPLTKQIYGAYEAFLSTLTKPQRATILDVLESSVVNVTDAEFLLIVNLTAATSVIITTNDG